MQDMHLFEYAVIRVVPRVEREEFLNVGVILYCAKRKFLKARILLNQHRVTAIFPELDISDVESNLAALEKIAEGTSESGAIGKLDPASRFRWLTATRSTVVQTSRVHPGYCDDAETALDRLFREQVL